MPPISPVKDAATGKTVKSATLTPLRTMSLEEVYKLITSNERLATLTLAVRDAALRGDENACRRLKQQTLPYVTPCGVFSRPPEPFDPAELTPAEPLLDTYPGQVSLFCQPVRSSTALSLTFENHTDRIFYHGDPPDYERLDVELEGHWYTVPVKPYGTAGVGTETGPGETFTYEPLLEAGYGDLPDGRYRICFGIWDVTSRGPGCRSCLWKIIT